VLARHRVGQSDESWMVNLHNVEAVDFPWDHRAIPWVE